MQRPQARPSSVMSHALCKLSSQTNNFDIESPKRWAPKARPIFFKGNRWEIYSIGMNYAKSSFGWVRDFLAARTPAVHATEWPLRPSFSFRVSPKPIFIFILRFIYRNCQWHSGMKSVREVSKCTQWKNTYCWFAHRGFSFFDKNNWG